jgi:hypothetical protein
MPGLRRVLRTLIAIVTVAVAPMLVFTGTASAATGPDLVVPAFDPKIIVHEGGIYTFSAPVRNQTTSNASAPPSTASIVMVPVAKVTVNGTVYYLVSQLETRPVVNTTYVLAAPIAPGTTSFAHAIFNGTNRPSGLYRIKVCADLNNNVAETDEGNNCRTVIRTI